MVVDVCIDRIDKWILVKKKQVRQGAILAGLSITIGVVITAAVAQW